MAITQIRILGSIQTSSTSKPLTNLRVEIWDENPAGYGWLASGVSDEKGNFVVVINDPVAALIAATTVTIKYKAFKDNSLLQEDAVSDYLVSLDILISDATIDAAFPETGNALVAQEIPVYINVSGRVTDSLSAPLAAMKVNVYEGVFRATEPHLVGSGLTDGQGMYFITVHSKNVNQTTVGRKILKVEVLDLSDTVLVTSDNIAVLNKTVTIDLQTETTNISTEFEKVVSAIQDIVGPTALDDVNEENDEISFISKAAGLDETLVKSVVVAHKVASDTGTDPDVLYTLLKKKGGDVQAVLQSRETDDRGQIEQAIENNVIGSYDEVALDSFYEDLRSYQVSKTKEISITGETYTTNDVFLNILPDQPAVDAFFEVYNQDHETMEDLWDSYTLANGGDPTLTERVKMGLKLASMTYFQPKIIDKLFTEIGTDDISTIAKWDLDTWKSHIADVCTTEEELCVPASIRGEETDPENTAIQEAYAEKLMAIAHASYPLAMVSGQLSGVDGGLIIEDGTLRTNVADFLDSNPRFDFRRNSIQDINDLDFSIPGGTTAAEIKSALAPFQRVMRVAGSNPAATCALISGGVKSSKAIRDMGYEKFLATYGDYFPASENEVVAYEPYFKSKSFSFMSVSFAPSAPAVFAEAATVAVVADVVTTSIVSDFGLTDMTTATTDTAIGIDVGMGGGVSVGGTLPPIFPGGFTTAPSDDPILSDLFGGMDFCNCCDCKSLVSPAAYLTDMLHFLKTKASGEPGAPSVYEALKDKRPDILNLDLTCKNSDTPMSYIDLVNELLELQILKPNADTLLPPPHGASALVDFQNFSFQTSGSREQLEAYPEHTYKDENGDYQDYTAFDSGEAYNSIYGPENLGGAVYPCSLPFSLPVEETRSYLSHFGVSRVELMKLFRPRKQSDIEITNVSIDDTTSEITDFSICAEWLGVSQFAATIITGKYNVCDTHPWKFYGCADEDLDNTNGVRDPNSYTVIPSLADGTVDWKEVLCDRIDVLLQQTGITYDELLQYLSTDYMNPVNPSLVPAARDVAIAARAEAGISPATCKLNELQLVFSETPVTDQETFFKKFHRFIRLVKTGKMSIYQWDAFLRSMAITDIDTDNFQLIGKALMLAEELNIEPEILACWWNNIDATDYLDFTSGNGEPIPSAYKRVFNNTGVINNAIYNYFISPEIPPTTTYVMEVGGQTISLLPQIANFCNIKEEEVKHLLLYYNIFDGIPYTTEPVTLNLLSRFLVLTKIAKAFAISIEDFVSLLSFCSGLFSAPALAAMSLNVTDPSALPLEKYIERLQVLVDFLNGVAASEFNVKDIVYLFADASIVNPLAPNPENIRRFYENIRQDLLSLGTPPTDSEELEEYEALQKKVFHQHFAEEFKVPFIAALDIFGGVEGDFVGTFTGDQYLINSTYSLSELNLQYIDSLPGAPGDTIPLPDWADPSNADNVQPTFQLSRLYHWYRHFSKVVFVVNKLKLETVDFQYVLNYPDALGFDFRTMPVYGISTAITGDGYGLPIDSALGLLRVSMVGALADKLSFGDGMLGRFVDLTRSIFYERGRVVYSSNQIGLLPGDPETSSGAYDTCLKEWCQMIVADVPSLVYTDYKDLKLMAELVGAEMPETGVTEYLSVPSLLRTVFSSELATSDFHYGKTENVQMTFDILSILDVCKRTGLTPTSLRKLLVADLTLQDSRNLIVAARGKYDEAGWAKVAKPLRDEIRVKQRDALIAYTTTNPNVVYANLLIDVEMDACMVTSRIKQAISSVQLLVDRVIMGIEYAEVEPGVLALVTIPVEAANEWRKWRKWMSIWQVNRKIFLYPENWLEPSLRDDKSVFFEELETQLRQDEVTFETAQAAISTYLHKVDEVAKLEPVGTCDEVTPTNLLITHVFARTYGGAQRYFHRTLCNDIWSPWKKIDVEIPSEHIVPVMWNNRLHLFWLTFQEKKVKSRTSHTSSSKWLFHEKEILVSDIGRDSDLRTQLQVSLNWTEYKEGLWQKQRAGKDDIYIDLNRSIESNIEAALTDVNAKRNIKKLSNNFELNAVGILKSRLYLSPHITSSGGLMLKLLLSESVSGFDEYAIFTHGFAFRPGSLEPTSMSNAFAEGADSTITSPKGTLFKNNGFISDFGNAPLQFDIYTDTFVSSYIYMTQLTGSIRRHNRASSHNILNANPYSGFRLTAKTEPMFAYGANPVADKFFYEDNVNVFFVRKLTLPRYSLDLTLGAISADSASLEVASGVSGVAYDSGGGLPGSVSPYYSSIYTPYSIDAGSAALGSSAAALSSPSSGSSSLSFTIDKYYFQTFYHSHLNKFIQALNTYGVEGMMRPDLYGINPLQDQSDTMLFADRYSPVALRVTSPHPTSIVDFYYKGAYACYNWEIFYHIPMLMAQRLADNQKFEEAQKWYHFIFDPTSNDMLIPGDEGAVPRQRFWKFWPFYHLAGTTIETLDDLLAEVRSRTEEAMAQINQYNINPFQPFAIARIRPAAFMKNVLMKYLDNLIAWGDNLFKRDTIESINEATQLYIMASNILGRKPTGIPPRAVTGSYSYTELSSPGSGIDDLGEASVAIESFLGPNTSVRPGSSPMPSLGNMAYFCLTPNDKLLGYWDTVADRLFKIRHCQNLDGRVRQLPIFEPPIDPALLVQAAASGVDVGSVLNDAAGGNVQYYRFPHMLQKANEFCNDVKALGGALLSAIEKKDAEGLALLRQGHEMNLLSEVLQQKKIQIEEANANLDALNKTRQNVLARYDYYNTREPLNSHEKEYFNSLAKSIDLQKAQMVQQQLSNVKALVPNFHAQATFAIGASFGGLNLGAAFAIIGAKLAADAAINNVKGSMASTKGGFDRRMDDWKFQAQSAKLEVEQIDKQIIATKIRIEIAKKDYTNQELQIRNSKEVSDYMHSKYTNAELYDWMINQVSTSYFNAYQIAVDLAKRAEKCYKMELPLSKNALAGFIKPKYWDSVKKGLLAGENLQYDLRRMEASYLQENKRTLELTKNFSLSMLDPEALFTLRNNGTVSVFLPEEVYDIDYPNHYNRRIKSVSITIPCVAGPYTTVPCTVSLTTSYVRRGSGDSDFDTVNAAAVPCATIATSTAQNDNGMFEANMKDERYLPFEGAGAICAMEVKLGGLTAAGDSLKPFDFKTINDVVVHVKYTAIEGTSPIWDRSESVREKLSNAVVGVNPPDDSEGATMDLSRVFSLKHEFPNEWFFYNSNILATGDPMQVTLKHAHFPVFNRRKNIQISGMYVATRLKNSTTGSYTLSSITGTSGLATLSALSVTASAYTAIGVAGSLSDIAHSTGSLSIDLLFNYGGIPANIDDKLDDVYLMVTYKVLEPIA